MLLENKSKRRYVHSYLDKKYGLKMLILEPHSKAEIPDDVAKGWLRGNEVIEYVDPNEARKEKDLLEKENAELKAKLEEMKAKQPEKKPEKKTTKTSTKGKKNTKSAK